MSIDPESIPSFYMPDEQDSVRYRPMSMRDFSDRAKRWASILDTPLQPTQEALARLYGYPDLHALQQDMDSAAKDPNALRGPFEVSQSVQAARDAAAFSAATQLLQAHRHGYSSVDSALLTDSIGLFAPPAEHRRKFQRLNANQEDFDNSWTPTVSMLSPSVSLMKTRQFVTFSFRAECFADIERFAREAAEAGIFMSITAVHCYPFPDYEAEVRADASLEQLRNLMLKVPDGHVMAQTILQCPLTENTL